MNRYKNHLIAAAVLIVLAVIGTIMNSRQASAQDHGPKVTIEAPIPLPVTGTIGVSGPISATVSGTVGLVPATSVSVNNTVSNPVRVRSVNDGIQPVQAAGSCFSATGIIGCSSGQFYSVPPGKRLVIEYASLGACSLPGQSAELAVETSVGGAVVSHVLPTTAPTTAPGSNAIGCNGVTPSSISATGQQLRLYADGGTNVAMFVTRDNNVGAGSYQFTMSGYLVDLPFAP